jgi:hypothetical protein
MAIEPTNISVILANKLNFFLMLASFETTSQGFFSMRMNLPIFSQMLSTILSQERQLSRGKADRQTTSPTKKTF